MSDFTHSLLVHGIASAKARELEEARRYLERALEQTDISDDERVDAWYWLSEISSDAAEQRNFLEEILARDPLDGRARRKLAIMNGQLKPEEMINPEHVPAQVVGDVDGEARRFTCPSCGGKMIFAPNGVTLICEYCTSGEHLRHDGWDTGGEQDFILSMATVQGHWKPATGHYLRCEGCGASFVLPPERLTMTCPYCQSAYVIETEETGEFVLPSALIPFAVDAGQAVEALRGWLEANLPREAKARVLGGTALYLPVWGFRVGGMLTWRGYAASNNRAAPLKMMSGAVDTGQEEVLVPASKGLFEDAVHELDAYDMSALVPYDERYLADWAAETYQVPVAKAALEARARFFRRRSEEARVTLHAVQELALSSADLKIDSFRLLLLPAWISRYRFEEREYALFVNGQTGVVRGERPSRGLGKLIDSLLGFD